MNFLCTIADLLAVHNSPENKEWFPHRCNCRTALDWSVVDFDLCHTTCAAWYIYLKHPFIFPLKMLLTFSEGKLRLNLQHSRSQHSINGFQGVQKYWIETNCLPKTVPRTVTLLKIRLWSGCDENMRQHEFVGRQGGTEIVICRGIGVTEGQDDLWSVNFQSSSVLSYYL